MASQRIISKQLGGVEDLLLDASGASTVVQQRASGPKTITKINSGTIPYEGVSGDSTFKSIKTALAERARTVDTLDDMILVDGTKEDTIVVKDLDRGGIFVYDSTKLKTEDNNGTIFASALDAASTVGCYVRQYETALNVKWFGANGNGNNLEDDHPAIQACLDYAITTTRHIYIPKGEYVLWSTLLFTEFDEVGSYYGQISTTFKPKNIFIEGESQHGTILRQKDSGFVGPALIELNGNYTNVTTGAGIAQIGNRISNLTLKGNSRFLSGIEGLKLRAQWICSYENISISEFNIGIRVHGVTAPTTDDKDTTAFSSFTHVSIHDNNTYGFLANHNRLGGVNFKDCEFRDNGGTGAQISGASIEFINCDITRNGVTDDTASGLVIAKGATGAQNRGMSIIGCVFEGNMRSEIKLADIMGASITGNSFHPYDHSPADGRLDSIFIQPEIDGIVEAIDIRGNRIQGYGGTVPLTFLYITTNVGIANNITESALSIKSPLITTPFEVETGVTLFKSEDFGVNTRIKSIEATVSANKTGAGTIFSFSDFKAASSTITDYDYGSDLNASAQVVVPYDGNFEVFGNWTSTGLTSAASSVVGFIYVNKGLANEVIYPCNTSAINTADITDVTTSIFGRIPAVKGDLIETAFAVYGEAGDTVDIVRSVSPESVYYSVKAV